MKKIITLLIVLVATTSLLAEYYDFQSGDLYYKFSYSSPDAVEVVSKISPWDHEAWDVSDNYPGLTNVTIPSTVTNEGVTYNVTGIGYRAFHGCSSLKSIIIPNSITSISGGVFWECVSLDSITIPNSVTDIGSYAFTWSGIYKNESNWENDVLYINDCLIEARYTIAGEYAIKEGTRLIAQAAFIYREELTSVIIPNSVAQISEHAFYGCSLLKYVTIPNTIKSIESCAFYECSSLVSITIPKNVASIGTHAFYSCSGLTSIIVESSNVAYDSRENCNALIETATNKLIVGCQNTIIPNSVTNIGEGAFEDCSALTSITIPNSVITIGDKAFNGCVFLKENFINNSSLNAETNNYWGAEFVDEEIDGLLIRNDTIIDCRPNVASVVIPETITTIGGDAFKDCSSLTSIIIPNSVTTIEGGAFMNCYSLTSIIIPNSVTTIEGYTFEDCSSLTFVAIGKNVKTIGEGAFELCSALSSITIPNSVTKIEDWAFAGCSALASIIVEGGNKTYDSRNNCNAIIETVSNRLIVGCHKTIIPSNITDIGNYAFVYCDSLKFIAIPNSVTTIGEAAFAECKSLESIIIPNSVTTLGYGAFIGCSSLSSITLPNSISSIDGEMFASCSSLTSITISESITSIESWAFEACSTLTTIICKAVEVPTLGKEVFYDMPLSEVTLYVPAQSLDDYKAAEQWKDFGTILPIEELPAAVENTHNSSSTANTQKLFRNGQLLIIRDGVEYNAMGQEL